MALPDTRHRARYLLGTVVVGHILLISAQVSSQSGPPVLQAVLMAALTAVQRSAWTVVDGVRGVWRGYANLQGVEAENQRLSGEITELRVRLQQERANAQGAGQLRALLQMRARVPWATAAAEVVAGSASPEFRSIIVDKGRQDGVRRDMPILGPSGVAGRVVAVAARTAVVQLVIDRSAAAAVVIERTRVQGIVLGNGDGTLRMEYLSAAAEIQPGDLVVTAGTDRVYPRGLVIGHVARADRAGSTYRAVVIRPVVDFSTLETVLVLLAPVPADAADEPQVVR